MNNSITHSRSAILKTALVFVLSTHLLGRPSMEILILYCCQRYLVGYPSLLAHHMSHSLNNPLIALHRKRTSTASKEKVHAFQPMTQSLPCDVRLLNLRSLVPGMNRIQSLLFLHRVRSDCDVSARVKFSCDTSFSSRVRSSSIVNLHSVICLLIYARVVLLHR